MNEEKQLILQMLKEGKITVEEASGLLEAISDNNKNKWDKFSDRLTGAVDSIIKKTTDTIQNFDIDPAIDLTINTGKNEINTEKELRIDDEINEISIDIINGSIEIDRADDSAITIKEEIFSKTNLGEDYLDIEVSDDKLTISIKEEHKVSDIRSNIKLSLGKNLYDSLRVNQVNGKTEISDVDFTNLDIDTVNGKIVLINTASNTTIKNTNGKIDLKNINGALSIENVNGSIYLTNIAGELAEVSNVNGNIRIDGLSANKLQANSNAGNIRIFKIRNTKAIDLESGFGNMVVDTTDYQGDIRADIESKAINVTEKFVNKIQDGKGYEISTNTEKTDLQIKAKSGFGKVSLR